MMATNADRLLSLLRGLPNVVTDCVEELACTAFDEADDDRSVLDAFRDIVVIHRRRIERIRLDSEAEPPRPAAALRLDARRAA